MMSKAQLLQGIQWLETHQKTYIFWAPIVGLGLGLTVTYLAWRLNNSSKRKVVLDESCLVCYNNPRDLVILPCKHIIICAQCLIDMDRCPLCRV